MWMNDIQRFRKDNYKAMSAFFEKKSFFSAMITLLVCVLIFVGCSEKENPSDTSASASAGSETSSVPVPPSAPTDALISIKCGTETASGTDNVVLEASKRSFRAGQKVEITLPDGMHFVAVNLAQGVTKEAILYLPDGVFDYTIPNLSYSYDTALKNKSKITITARIPTDEELTAPHNLSLNPFDLLDGSTKIRNYKYSAYWSGGVFPHATTSSVCRIYDSEESKYQFEARNIIDGYTKNNGHGGYPFQSWGPDSDFSQTKGYIMIDFGHEVNVNSLLLYIRADFPHDTYFTAMTVEFSDGSRQVFTIEKNASAQSFDLGNVNTSFIRITNLKKEQSDGWAALSEIEIIGKEIIN